MLWLLKLHFKTWLLNSSRNGINLAPVFTAIEKVHFTKKANICHNLCHLLKRYIILDTPAMTAVRAFNIEQNLYLLKPDGSCKKTF